MAKQREIPCAETVGIQLVDDSTPENDNVNTFSLMQITQHVKMKQH